jgi:3-oxoadipate enol-lactonase
MAQRFRATDGVEIVYDAFGSGTDTVVLCHGLAAAGEQLLPDAQHFADRGFRVLVPDLRGHGRSGKPTPLDRDNLSIGRLATDLVEMLDHAAAPHVHWVGNSLGGIVALWMLREHEERFRTLATFGTSYRLKLPDFWAPIVPPVQALLGKPLCRLDRGAGDDAQCRGASVDRQADPAVRPRRRPAAQPQPRQL